MQRRDDPEAAAVFDFVSSYLDELERGGARTLAQWLARYPGHEASVAREWLALQPGAAPATSAAEDDARRVGPYRVLGELGRGGQGAVFLAEDTRIARRVALKVLGSHFDSVSEERRRRFRREAEVIARLDHPGICGIYEADIEGATPYLAMRLVEGEPLAVLLARARERQGAPGERDSSTLSRLAREWPPRTPFDVRQVLHFFERAARALHAAHEAGVVHRDVKPGNLMVTAQGAPVWLDFGLAREEQVDDASQLTQEGDVFGTPAYMSPEQLARSSRELDRRTDVYSLGASMYEALTLRRPFEAATRAELYRRIAEAPLDDPRVHNPALSSEVAVVLATALERERERRYPTALELAEDLRRIREYEPIRARPAGPLLRLARWTRRNPLLAATIVALAGGLSFALWALSAERAALRVALGRYLAGRCEALVPEDPAAALVLGSQACELAPNYLSRAALLEALGECRLEQELRCGDAMASALALAPDGHSAALALRGTSTERDAGRVRVFDLERRGASFDCAGAPAECAGLVFDASGARLVVGAPDGRLAAFDAHDGHALETLALPHDVVALERTPDGTRLLALSGDGRATLCELAPLSTRASFAELGPAAARARFASDGRSFVAPTADARGLARWDAASGARLDQIALPAALASFACAPTAGDASLLCGLQDGRLVHVGADGTQRTLLCAEAGWSVDYLAWSPDGRHAVACAGRNESGGAWLIDLGGAPAVDLGDARERRVFRAAFAPDGTRVATASFDLRVCIFEVGSARAPRVMRGRLRAQELCWTADARRLVTRNVGTGAMVWIASELPDVFELDGPHAAPRALEVTRDGQRALGLGADGTARLWRLAGGIGASGATLRSFTGAEHGGFAAQALAPDGDWAVLAGADGALLRVELEREAAPERIAPAGSRSPRALALDASGELLLVLGEELRVLDRARGWRDALPPVRPAPECAALLPDRAGLVTGWADGRVRRLALESGACAWERALALPDKHALAVRELCVARDGSELAVAAGESFIYRLASRDGAQLDEKRSVLLPALHYNPRGGQLLAVGRHGGGGFKLFDTRTRAPLPLEVFHLDELVDGAFSPDGKLVATLSRDGACYVRATEGGLPVTLARLDTEGLGLAWAGGPEGWRLLVSCADGAHCFPVDPLPAARARQPRELATWELAYERRLALPLRYDP